MIFTSLSPNTESDDISLAAKLRFFPSARKVASGSRIRLEQAFASYMGVGEAFAFDSGRTSLYAILSSLNLPQGAEILLQAYTCVAVPEPILWTAHKPVYIDIADDLTMDPSDLEKKITPRSKVLIIQHTFGMPAKLDELLAIAHKHDLFVIEDCAHALGSEYKSSVIAGSTGNPGSHYQKVGTFGDAAFFSLGRDKVISSVFGGVAIIKNPLLAEKIKKLQDSYPDSPLSWVKKQLNHPIIFSIAKPIYDFADLGKYLIEITKRLGIFSKAVEKTELSGGKPSFAFHRMSDILASLALHQFSKLERFNDHRKKLARIYEKSLSPTWVGISSRGISDERKSIFLRYTLFAPAPKHLALYMKERDVLLGDWYTEGIAPKNVVYEKIGYVPKSCPNAEALALRSVNLPTGIQTTENDAQMIANEIKEYLNGNQRN